MHPQLPAIADDQELPAAFHQVKATRLNLGNQPAASDFAFHIADRPADDAPALHRFRPEYLRAPIKLGLGRTQRSILHVHAVQSCRFW